MSTVKSPRIVLANILYCLFVFVVSISVLFAYDVGLIGFNDISSTFLRSCSPSPPPSSPSTVLDSGNHYHGDLTALDHFKVPAFVTLLILMLLAIFYIRNIYGHRFTPDCYQSFNQCVTQVRQSLLLQHNEVLASGLQKATADAQKATANVKQEQAMSKFHREMVEAACRKYVEFQTASTEALRRSNNELVESKQSVVRLNTLVNHLRQDLEHSAQEHKRDVEAADRNRLKAIDIARYAQAEANALRSEAVSSRLELDAMRVEIGVVRRDLGASKRRARVARNEAGASHTEDASLRSALAASRKEISTIRKGAKALIAELQAQRANNKKGVKSATFPDPETNSVSVGRDPNGTDPPPQQPNRVSNEGTVTSSNARSATAPQTLGVCPNLDGSLTKPSVPPSSMQRVLHRLWYLGEIKPFLKGRAPLPPTCPNTIA